MVHHNKNLEVRLVRISEQDVVRQISSLLTGCLDDLRESRGGHIPDSVVTDFSQPLYASVSSITKTFAQTGYRFAALNGTEVLGTILIAKSPDFILHADSKHLNLHSNTEGFSIPKGYHFSFNFAIKKEERERGLARFLLERVMRDFRKLFSGKGICSLIEPPLHDAFIRMGFTHRYKFDQYFPKGSIAIPKGVSSIYEFNKKFQCLCSSVQQKEERFSTQKLKCFTFTIDFE